MATAVQIIRPGNVDEMKLVNVEVGDPGPGEVRIRHKAIGVNFIDIYQRSGMYQQPMPLILGKEGSGVIEAVGAEVTHLRPGDRAAYASESPGSYSTERVLYARTVSRLPDEIDFQTGAAMMLKGLTAQCLLRRTLPVRGLQSGDNILWHAAAGGVGLIACQWARTLGYKLIATAGSDEKCMLALANGASHAINYKKEDFVAKVHELTLGQGVKAVYDAVGKDTLEKSLKCLSPFGLIASFGNASGPVPALNPAALAPKCLYFTRTNLFAHIATHQDFQSMTNELFDIIRDGKVRIHIGQRFPLAEVKSAHLALEERRTTGSTVLLV